jgi:DHA1 family bicyclomycin/chloramphenicol resistance-like MFS transporter
MKLKPDTLAMTIALAALTALGPLSTDFYLPSLPDIAVKLQATTAGAQATLSSFLFGFAAGQLIWGPLSDRLGRKPVLYMGLGLFLVATAACAFSASIEQLIIARFIQAVGASGPIVLGRAMVRDLYDGPRAGRELSRMGMIMGLVPAVAPVFGGLLHDLHGWRSTFIASLGFGALIAVVIIVWLPETLRERSREPLSLLSILRGFRVLLRNKAYRAYLGLTALAYAGLFSFISGSSFVLIDIYRLSPVTYGLSFGFGVLGFITGTIIAQRRVGQYGLDKLIGIGTACLAMGGILMTLAVLFIGSSPGLGPSLAITLPMALYAAGVGLVMPQAQASAMMPFPDRAGAASSLVGLCQMTLSALVGLLVGFLLRDSALPLPLVIATIGCMAAALFWGTRDIRALKA